jgi:asparagine synthetase B (glutamine-hydrolysing)
MSFIAGYLTRKEKYESLLLEEKVKSFAVLSDEVSEGYDSSVIETKFGHIIQKYNTKYPIQSKPYRDGEGNSLVTLGFLYRADLLNDAKKILEDCVRNSADALEEYEGEFVAIYSEGHSGNIHIVNDRFASRPFYILWGYDHAYFSSNLAFLLYLAGGKHEIDILSWFQIFSFGHTCGTRTTTLDVRRIEPAAHLVISPGGIYKRQYWRIEHKPETDLDPAAYSTKVFDAFQAGTALRAKLTRKGLIALSGGLDSRLVAAAIPKDVDFSAFTFVDSAVTFSTTQTQTAAEVSKALGLTHQIQPISRFQFSQVASQVIRLTGGLRPLHHMAVVMSYVEEMRAKGLNFLLGGGPGDIIAGSKIPSLDYIDPDSIDKCIKDFCRRHVPDRTDFSLLFHKDIVNQYFRDLYKSLIDSFESIPGPTAAHRVTNWAMIHRWPAFTFTSVIHNHPEIT